MTDIANEYKKVCPLNMDLNKAHELTFMKTEQGIENSLGVFIRQEIARFNILLSIVRSSLDNLRKAIEGTVVMSMDLEAMFNSFIDAKVPHIWMKDAYPCLKPLASWMKDLILRIEFISDWLYKGPPNTYWIPSFFFPQGFMTASLQTYARKNATAIDTLAFRTNVMPWTVSDVHAKPEIGVYIHGLYMQGARFDDRKKCVDDSMIGKPIVEFPVLWLEPIMEEELKIDKAFHCPLYKTSIRAGELSTTGHSTNFVMYLHLNCEKDADYWVRRGAALLCMTDN